MRVKNIKISIKSDKELYDEVKMSGKSLRKVKR